MRIGGGLAKVLRRFVRWVRTGDGGPATDREIESSPLACNDSFVADLNEAQRRAVLGAIFAARRPLPGSVGLD